MNLINTGIIRSDYDIYWKDISTSVPQIPRPILILINDYEAGSEDDLQLSRMIVGSKLGPEVYNLVKVPEGGKIPWHQLRDLLKPRFVFLIGILPAQLGISVLFRLHLPNNFNGCKWLPTLALSEHRKSEEMRKYLWDNGMKPLFVNDGPILPY
jgi:hypothetical protein